MSAGPGIAYDATTGVISTAATPTPLAPDEPTAEQAEEDYSALLDAGLPEQTARRLSGHTPPQNGEHS
ncbi:hypothetical protein ACH4Q7_22955 [Streptomyces roseolus]|uniref:hypothetical protein n=1 Tax=Streptomyces roseolus TaxID=67358 RepID=UPI0037A5EB20